MANLPLLLIFSTILLVSTLPSTVSAITQQVTSTVAKDQVPCTMCSECENPCQPLPPPPPIPVIECPPPPSPSPPPPSPPPLPPPPPPAVIECPPPPSLPPPSLSPPPCSPCEQLPPPSRPLPPPKPPCADNTCLPSLLPPPMPEVPYFPPGPPRPPAPGLYPTETDDYDGDDKNDGGMIMPALRFSNSLYFTLRSFTFVALLCLPYCLFV